jgi:hypothetical protein
MAALRDDLGYVLPEINAPTLTKKLEKNLRPATKVDFKQTFCTAEPEKITHGKVYFSKDMESILYILMLIVVITIIMMLRAYSEEGFGKGLKDAKTELTFRQIMNSPPSS